MGGKRKRERAEVIQRKTRRLESASAKKGSRRIIYSSSEDDCSDDIVNNQTQRSILVQDQDKDSASLPQSILVQDQDKDSVSLPRSASPAPVLCSPAMPGTSVAHNKETEHSEDLELDEEILRLLGDAPRSDVPLGPPIHKDIANRWQEILAKGLTKEAKEQLLKDYAVPSNCDLLFAPTLNLEAKAALPEAQVKRDSFLMQKQKQLGTALSALAVAINCIISNETSKQVILKPLSDACRILCDSHYMDTRTRRNLVMSSINTDLKDTLVETSRDKFLFGENIGEKVKAAKNIQRSGEALKHLPKTVFHKSNFISKNKGHLNYTPMHRKSETKPNLDIGRRSRPTQRQLRNPVQHRVINSRSPLRRSHRK